MSVKTEIWVQAFMRRCAAEGLYGAVIAKGAAEAGALFVIVNHLDGTCHLFGPAPGPAFDGKGERRWIEEVKGPIAESQALTVFARRRKADPDCWGIEIEDRKGMAGISASS
ncbi:MAG: DUF1491 family protein [Rhizobiales bacterium]|nr:DUF1491 family protein [Hyphomicrobiales bacterium]